MAEGQDESKSSRETIEERAERIRALLQDRGEDMAKLVRTGLQSEDGK
jgi:flagellar biosynthesis/type III secretory pathway M-ring protein FliF/YscJ